MHEREDGLKGRRKRKNRKEGRGRDCEDLLREWQ